MPAFVYALSTINNFFQLILAIFLYQTERPYICALLVSLCVCMRLWSLGIQFLCIYIYAVLAAHTLISPFFFGVFVPSSAPVKLL